MRKVSINLLGSDVAAIEDFRMEMIEREKGRSIGHSVDYEALSFEKLVEVFITVKVGEMKRGESNG